MISRKTAKSSDKTIFYVLFHKSNLCEFSDPRQAVFLRGFKYFKLIFVPRLLSAVRINYIIQNMFKMQPWQVTNGNIYLTLHFKPVFTNILQSFLGSSDKNLAV